MLWKRLACHKLQKPDVRKCNLQNIKIKLFLIHKVLNCLITYKKPEWIKSQNFEFTKSLVVNLYKRASLTHQSPTTKTGKQVSTVLVPTLTTTKKKSTKEHSLQTKWLQNCQTPTLPVLNRGTQGRKELIPLRSTTRAHEAFQIPTGLSAQWEETVMEHSVLKFFLSFHIPTPCWVQFRWQAGQVKKLILALYAL